jgi:hypothetical protein
LLLAWKEKMNYSYGAYNKFDDKEQWIRITEGCPHHHEFCYEPTEIKVFGVPEIVRNKVKIMDMNLLCKPEAIAIIKELGDKRVNDKVVYYELICGVDFRFLTQEIANTLHENRFKKIRLAWDLGFTDQLRVKKAIEMLRKAGYRGHSEIMVFMICNWKVPYERNCLKLDLLKVWRVQVSDCWFDNQLSTNIKPLHWEKWQISDFRKKCRMHNKMVTFGFDPEEKV